MTIETEERLAAWMVLIGVLMVLWFIWFKAGWDWGVFSIGVALIVAGVFGGPEVKHTRTTTKTRNLIDEELEDI